MSDDLNNTTAKRQTTLVFRNPRKPQTTQKPTKTSIFKRRKTVKKPKFRIVRPPEGSKTPGLLSYLHEARQNRPHLLKLDFETIKNNADMANRRIIHKNIRRQILTNINLERSKLVHLEAEGASFEKACMRGAQLTQIRGKNVCFFAAQMENASIQQATLRKANFQDANLQNSLITKCDLKTACLIGANLRNAVLCDVDLSWANLKGADLTNSILCGVRLKNAVYDDNTRWPADFTPSYEQMIKQ
ncbi:MAG: pentapeptide repeat-containing protein [Myxococcota bacterium]|nr:pentapeptide repeat-containing protein [Myxococcota bacterium]